MARIDVPTMQCDRCKWITQDLMEIGKFTTIKTQWSDFDGKPGYDLCYNCIHAFDLFVNNKPTKTLVRVINGTDNGD